MEQATRNKLRNTVTKCRKLLEDSIAQQLQGQFGIHKASKTKVSVEDESRMSHLSDEDKVYRRELLDHFEHIKAGGFKPVDSLDQLIREIAFTHLNRLCAYKMMEAREVYVGGKKFRESVSRGISSNGFKFYLADHPDDERLFNTGNQELAYRHFLDWIGGLLSEEIGVLFNPHDPANRLYPRQKILDELLELLNDDELAGIWDQDETIGWVYQYFTPKELRDKAKKESATPRNSYELAFRNQFFTPRYVVEFLTDNTLGRIWYEMQQGNTALTEQCSYLVRRPSEVFLNEGQDISETEGDGEDLSQEELLRNPVQVPFRPKKDPRELKVLDPACGSGHFLLYCFDLLLTIYGEAYDDPDLGPKIQGEYPEKSAFQKAVPGLILANNLHGIDIDLRASQIAALALWLRCQRVFKEQNLRDRPKITRSNFVCAEPMPGEKKMLSEFTDDLRPKVLGQLVEVVFDKMQLVGEAGSLLKIEEELRKAIAGAKKQWQDAPKEVQLSLFDGPKPPKKPEQQVLFDTSGITDDEFWDQAEAKVLLSLEEYAGAATNGASLQRQLFADDTARGFAFIDLSQKRFDVLLMNPPFGSPSDKSKTYIAKSYKSTKEDIDAAFVNRAFGMLRTSGLLGAIVNRTQYFKPGLRAYRENDLLNKTFIASGDLGYGVLDGALVEATAYAVAKEPVSPSRSAPFFRLLKSVDKGTDLLGLIERYSDNTTELEETFVAVPSVFLSLPESRIGYWATRPMRAAFRRLEPLTSRLGEPQFGVSTKKDFRFLRLAWEVPESSIVTTENDCNREASEAVYCWVPFAKGGEYAPYFGDIHLLVDWTQNGGRISDYVANKYPYLNGNTDWILHPESDYFDFGLTYTRRTTSGFSPRILPSGCVFSEKGLSIFSTPRESAVEMLGVLMTRIVAYFIELMVESGDAVSSGSAARSYEINILASVPVPVLDESDKESIGSDVRQIFGALIEIDSTDETGRYFVSPSFVTSSETLKDRSLTQLAEQVYTWREDHLLSVLDRSWRIEQRVRDLYELDAQTLREIDIEMEVHPSSRPERESFCDSDEDFAARYKSNISEIINAEVDRTGGSRAITKKCYYSDRHLEILSNVFDCHPASIVRKRRNLSIIPPMHTASIPKDLLSYAVGCTFGRWDVRFATGEREQPPLPEPVSVVPTRPVAHLADSLPDAYPVAIDADGILVDDAGNSDDIVANVCSVLELFWNENAESIENEACSLLKAKSIRDYFRKPGKGGFWSDHIGRYSKSRRKAPIYWLLQSENKNYGIWVYYHRFDKDILFKALLKYVEPKVRLEQGKLAPLRAKFEETGGTGQESKKLGRNIEKLEDFITELQDFEDKLRRAAELQLEPDLNDGVVLNIAPLHELVPWKEAKKFWDELLEGEHEWSSIGKQLREKGMVKSS